MTTLCQQGNQKSINGEIKALGQTLSEEYSVDANLHPQILI